MVGSRLQQSPHNPRGKQRIPEDLSDTWTSGGQASRGQREPVPSQHTRPVLCTVKAGLTTKALAQAENCTTQDAHMGGPEPRGPKGEQGE